MRWVYLTNNYHYDAFGNELTSSNNSNDDNNNQTNTTATGSISNPSPFRFASEYLDAHSGSYYLRARHFNPGTGRFLQADPHWNVGNMIFGDSDATNSFNGGYSGLGSQAGQSSRFRQSAVQSSLTHGQSLVRRHPIIVFNLLNNAPQPSPHSLSIMQSGNLFVYTMNNPVAFNDPSGRVAVPLVPLIPKGLKWIAKAVGTAVAGASVAYGIYNVPRMSNTGVAGSYVSMSAAATNSIIARDLETVAGGYGNLKC